MTGFLTPTPRLFHIPVKDGRLAITLDDVVWVEEGQNITVTRGFPTDGLSLPGIATALGFDPWGAGLRAALLHDAGYSLHDVRGHSLGNKATVDRRFLAGCLIDYPRMATTYYRAVRWFGGFAWRKANVMHMAGYLYAVQHGHVDEWIGHLLEQHGGAVVDLEPAP
jgi:hypothetical protein